MWNNAWTTARNSSRIARLVCPVEVQDFFVAGLLHNVGELLLVYLLADRLDPGLAPDLITAGLARCLPEHHEWFGERFVRDWSLPPLVSTLAARHHSATSDNEPRAMRVNRSLVLAAWTLALRCGVTYLPGQWDVDPLPNFQAAGLSEERIAQLLSQLDEVTK
jgi:HD-like signal output (HDOD) protein